MQPAFTCIARTAPENCVQRGSPQAHLGYTTRLPGARLSVAGAFVPRKGQKWPKMAQNGHFRPLNRANTPPRRRGVAARPPGAPPVPRRAPRGD